MADILSQEEIDALYKKIDDKLEEEEEEVVDDDSEQVTFYDFRRPNRISRQQLREICAIHDKWCRNLTTEIGKQLQSIIEIQLHSIYQMTYGEFLMSLPSPTSFNSFKNNESEGIIELSPSIAFPLIDKLLGGRGDPYKASRGFTDAEEKILEALLKTKLQELSNSWSEECGQVDFELDKRKSSPNEFQIVNQNEIVVVVACEIITHSSGMLNLCYTTDWVESKIPKESQKSLFEKAAIPEKDYFLGRISQHNRELEAFFQKEVALGDLPSQIQLDGVISFPNKVSLETGGAQIALGKPVDLEGKRVIKIKKVAEDLPEFAKIFENK